MTSRRKFLKTLGAGAALSALALHTSCSEEKKIVNINRTGSGAKMKLRFSPY